MCLVFDFRLCEFVGVAYSLHDYCTDNNIIIILLILNNAFSYLLVLHFNPKAFTVSHLVTPN